MGLSSLLDAATEQWDALPISMFLVLQVTCLFDVSHVVLQSITNALLPCLEISHEYCNQTHAPEIYQG